MTPSAAALVAAGWLAGWCLAGRTRSLADVAPEPDGPSTSVVIPARDEEARLPRLLAALALADPPPAEVLVVDDGSTDATARLAREFGARVVRVEPPAGWTGKAWACQRGAEEATGEIVVFLDADTEPAPAAVARLAAAAARHGALVSAQPRHRVERAYERLSAGPALVTLLGAGTGGPPRHRWWRRPVAFGPAVAARREAYLAWGGHEPVRARVDDDLALARTADAAGVPVVALLGGDQLAYRMYPEGIGRLVEGWGKNLAVGAGSTPPLRLAATVLWVTGALRSGVALAADPGAASAAGYAAYAGQVAVLLRRVGRFGPTVPLLHPVAVLAFVALFGWSVARTTVGRTVPWRGRRVAVRS